jgi:hypothetical protein
VPFDGSSQGNQSMTEITDLVKVFTLFPIIICQQQIPPPKQHSAACSCGAEAETLSHFLSNCPLWDSPRQELQQVLGDRRSDLSYALGEWSGRIERRTGKHVDGNRDQWKPEIMAIKAVIQFVKATGKLQPQQRIEMEGEGGQRGSSG